MVETNPNNDPDTLDEADDHMRLIKTAVKGSFPNLGAVAVTKTAAEVNDLVDKSSAQAITGVKTMTSPVLTTPDIGTPSAGVLTNCTGTAAGLTAGDISNDVVTAAKINTTALTRGTLTLAATGNTTVPEGFYTFSIIVATSTYLEVRDSGGTWRRNTFTFSGGTVMSDGTNVRFYNSGAAGSAYYAKLA